MFFFLLRSNLLGTSEPLTQNYWCCRGFQEGGGGHNLVITFIPYKFLIYIWLGRLFLKMISAGILTRVKGASQWKYVALHSKYDTLCRWLGENIHELPSPGLRRKGGLSHCKTMESQEALDSGILHVQIRMKGLKYFANLSYIHQHCNSRFPQNRNV